MGKGTGKREVRYRKNARDAASQANWAVPCWIMRHDRVSESLPPNLGDFDLVIVDEASQSDLVALPVLLRAQKVLIVGDDKQVSPEGVGLEEKIRHLMDQCLGNQVGIYKSVMSPERSIYDLFKTVYANNTVMLKEHFRCVHPIIEYSKREFYNHELIPIRLPKMSERLDPPLIDVLIQDGYRAGDENIAEAKFIVAEIKKIVNDESLSSRSIGIVSLLAKQQACRIRDMLIQELGSEVWDKHRIAYGGASDFQGKERDIVFLSMVVAPNELGAPLTRETYAQRFNVAASRARDRMYLVRSVSIEQLSPADKFRRSLIAHFSAPFSYNESCRKDTRELCESEFEKAVYDVLTERGYRVIPQVQIGQLFRIDMVVEGENDARLAIECDGDQYHGPEKWEDDIARQRMLERAGWVFWRCLASTWFRRREEMIEDLIGALSENNVYPTSSDGVVPSLYCEQRVVNTLELDIVSNNDLKETIEDSEQT
ncbi:MAG: hypothetical protein IPK86_03210 [Neisseriales bacterium]|nr:MAG: hypothetical protein IPK86_03210 [Neisseriales bacterium]